MDKARTHRLIKLDDLTQGKPHRIEHNGKGILLCRIEASVYAVNDTCPHEDISLSLGVLCEHRLRCPLHGSEFDVRTGHVLNEPAEQDLPIYPVEIEAGWVCMTQASD